MDNKRTFSNHPYGLMEILRSKKIVNNTTYHLYKFELVKEEELVSVKAFMAGDLVNPNWHKVDIGNLLSIRPDITSSISVNNNFGVKPPSPVNPTISLNPSYDLDSLVKELNNGR